MALKSTHFSLDFQHPDRAASGRQKTGPVSCNRLLTVKEAAEWCQVSERQLRRLIKVGALPVKRFGKAIRIRPRDLGL
jgi:excisionase family DNA binding protein